MQSEHNQHLDDACRAWLDLVARAGDTEDDERLARVIADHIATCPACATSEAALTALIDRYRRADEPSLPDQLERRLRDCIEGLTQR